MRGLVLMAPHFGFTEEMGLAEIRHANADYAAGGLRDKLKRWHSDVDSAFRAWSEPGSVGFSRWDITEALGYSRVPLLIVKVRTTNTARSSRSRRRSSATARSTCLPEHSAHRDAPAPTLEIVSAFIKSVAARPSRGERKVNSGVAA